MYLLDTNVVSELRKVSRGRANQGVARWASNIATDAMFLSVATIFEIEIGIARLDRRDTAQAQRLQAWLQQQLLPTFLDRILPIDIEIARHAAKLHVPAPRPFHDALIAATAGIRGFTVVTRNVSDFAGTGVRIVNPWIF